MAIERRRWECPGCARAFRIPATAPTPQLCPDCANAATDDRTITSEAPRVSRKLLFAWLLSGTVVAVTVIAMFLMSGPDKEKNAHRNAKLRAEILANAVVSGHWDIVLDSTLGLEELSESERKKFVEVMKHDKSWKMSFEEIKVEDASCIANDGSVWIVVFPNSSSGLLHSGGWTRFKMTSFIVGVSADDGETWKYQDATNVPSGEIEKMYPTPMKDIILPKCVMTIGDEDDSTFMRSTLVDGNWVADKATVKRLKKILERSR